MISYETLTMPAATGTQNENGSSIFILNQIIWKKWRYILSSTAMNAAAPDGTPRRRFYGLLKNETSLPRRA